jgi:hypothetical protein
MKYLENQADELKDDKLVSDLEEKLNSIVSSISFGDIQHVFNEIKEKVVSGDGMAYNQGKQVDSTVVGGGIGGWCWCSCYN